MRKNKGFTLIELLAVIVILGIIMVIAGTSVIGSIRDTKEKAKYMAAKDIADIARVYIETENKCSESIANSDNKISCKDDDGKTMEGALVMVKDLCQDGYIEKDSTNPDTGENIKECAEFGNQYVRVREKNAHGDQVEKEEGYKAQEFKRKISGVCETCLYYSFEGYQYGVSNCFDEHYTLNEGC